MNKKIPPAIAAIATIPTTTPAAMPALLGEDDFDDVVSAGAVLVDELLAVTTTVCPPTVTTDGLAVDVGDAVVVAFFVAVDTPSAYSTFVVRPEV
jgi:hypothetical protein